MESRKINPWQILGTVGISIGFISSMAIVFWTWIAILSELGILYFLASAILFTITLILAIPIVWILKDGFPVILALIWMLMWAAPTAGVVLAITKPYDPSPED